MKGNSGISAAIITRNEAQQLPTLLASLNWVDEVIVVDSCSDDQTAEIARDWGCRVIERPFDNYSAQRNRAIAAARYPWVLSIDADERPVAGFEIGAIRAIDSGRFAALRVPIRSRIFGRSFRFSGTQHDRPVRFFRRDSARWYGRVHETLRVDGRVGTLSRGFTHDTIADLHEFLTKMRRYTLLEAKARVERGDKPRWHDAWSAPAREVFRRLVFQLGGLDGPEGVAFGLLSGFSEWNLAATHRRLHDATSHTPRVCSVVTSASADFTDAKSLQRMPCPATLSRS